MPLAWQTVSVPFTQGRDAKRDPKQLAPGKLTAAQNVRFSRPGAIAKRNGFAALLDADIEYEGMGGPDAGFLATFKNELLAGQGYSLLTLDDSDADWSERAKLDAVTCSQRSISRSGITQTSADSARHSGGRSIWVWIENNAVRYSVIDDETGAVLVQSAAASGTLASEHVVMNAKAAVVGDFFLVGWVDRNSPGELGTATQEVDYVSIPVTTLVKSAVQTLVTLRSYPSGETPQRLWDWERVQVSAGSIDRVYVTWVAADISSNPQVGFRYIYVNAGSITLSTAGSFTADAALIGAVAIWPWVVGGTNQIVIAWGKSGGGASYLVTDFSAGSGGTPVSLGTTGTVVNITGVSDGTLSWVSYSYTSSGATITRIYSNTSDILMQDVRLVAKPLVRGGWVYLVTAHVSADNEQPTIFVWDHLRNIVARMAYREAGVSDLNNVLAETIQDDTDSNVYEWAGLVRARLYQDRNGLDEIYWRSLQGVNAMRLEFDPVPGTAWAEMGNNLNLGGGFLRAYDGADLVEQNFHIYPENLSSSGGSGNGNIYQYQACYEWNDNQGNLHRSAPSTPILHTQSASVAPGNQITVTVPNLRLTAKEGVRIALYRTVTNAPVGSVLYKVTEVANDEDSLTQNITDGITDALLVAGTQLYTAGGVVENLSPGPGLALVRFGNRLFVADSEQTTLLWYSKEVIPGFPVEFSDTLVMGIPEEGGAVTALGVMDGKLVVFKANRIFVVTGDGPDPTGNNNSFSPPQQVQTDVGCINHRSVVATPLGLMFQSEKGIYLLDRSLSVQYLGAEVEDYNESTITSALLMPDTQEVRFTLAESATALVYDYLVGQWVTYTNVANQDACLFRGLFTFIAVGYVYQETPDTFTDVAPGGAETYIQMLVTTGWLQVGTLQGFQRLRRVSVLGEYRASHTLTLAIAYDYDTTTAETVLAAQSSSGPYQWRFQPARQKCEAFQLTLSDSSTDTDGEGLELSALGLEVGIKPGLGRRPVTKAMV